MFESYFQSRHRECCRFSLKVDPRIGYVVRCRPCPVRRTPRARMRHATRAHAAHPIVEDGVIHASWLIALSFPPLNVRQLYTHTHTCTRYRIRVAELCFELLALSGAGYMPDFRSPVPARSPPERHALPLGRTRSHRTHAAQHGTTPPPTWTRDISFGSAHYL